MAKFFIERPIFAWVIAIFIMVVGAVSITQLPVAQYPAVAPPRSRSPPPTPAPRPRRWKTAFCP